MISKTNSNERSWAIQIIKDVEKYSQRKNYIIKEVGGEVTISNGNKKMFPDILLFADDTRSCILQGWEIKMPDISIFDTSFINDAWRKAEVLGLNSTFIWNFRYGVLYVKNKTTNKFEESARWDISKHISKKREDVTIFEHIWKKTLFEAVDVINDYLTTNKYREITIGEAVSSTVVNEIINNNKDLVANHLKKTSKSNLVLHSFLQVWWDDVKDEYIKDESNISSAYAKVLLLNWITKFILAHLISQKNSEAHSLILEINNESTPKQALNIFEKITKRFDFYSIFNPLDYQEIIPNITWTEILELHSFLITNGANVLNQDDLQKILENTTSLSNRLIIGQFTTPKKLAEFMVKSVMTNIEKICFDPCCGSGTIPKEIIKHKYSLLKDHVKAFETTLASDKFSFPLQITNISLTSSETINIPCRLFKRDVFDLNSDDLVEIINPTDGNLLQIPLNDISFIISNLPFIDFNKNNLHKDERNAITKKIIADIKMNTGIELDNRSDYSFFIIFHLWNIMKNGGRACFIISSSWIGTNSGSKFIKALRYYYHIKGIYISSAEKWFKNADVVSTILILEKKIINEEDLNFVTNYFKINKKLESLTEHEMNKAVLSSLSFREIDNEIVSVHKHTINEIETIREKFGFSYSIAFSDFGWLKKFESKILSISDLFKCFAGIKSGDNNLFYSTEKNNIDEIYYSPILKDTRYCSSYICQPDMFVIDCNKTYEELKTLGNLKTIHYFESKQNSLNQSTKARGDVWWRIPQIENKALLFTALAPYKRIFFGRLTEVSVIDQRVVGYFPLLHNTDIELAHALLNSIFTMFIIEATGFGRGQAVLDLNRTKLKTIKMLNPNLLSEESKEDIKIAFRKLCERDIKDELQDEINSKDREDFDLTILKSFNLEAYYMAIKNSLLDLYKIRMSVTN